MRREELIIHIMELSSLKREDLERMPLNNLYELLDLLRYNSTCRLGADFDV